MKNKTKLLLLGLLLPGMSAFGQAQSNKNSNDATPPSVQSGGSTVHGVDLYTGIGSVSIPIYDYNVDGLNLGVSLGYSLNGLKVDEISTSVGAGWGLNAGGSISRTVYDQEDEVIIPAAPGPGNYSRAGRWMWNHDDDDQGFDIFNLDLAGKSYQFTYKQTLEPNPPGDRKYRVSPKSEISIDITMDDLITNKMYQHPFTNQLVFTITDEKGNKFIYNAADYELTQRSMIGDENQKFDFRPVNKWNLTKIITYSGQEVRFFYKPFGVNMPFYANSVVQEAKDSIRVKRDESFWTGISYHIERIEYPNGTTVFFDFDDNDATKQRCDNSGNWPLKDIRVVSQYSANVKNTYTYRFNYAYFNSPKGNNSATEISYPTPCSDIAASYGLPGGDGNKYLTYGLRLKLKGIDKVGTDGTTTEPYYRFEYNNTPLPPRLHPAKDYYGFYNGKAPVNPSSSCGNYSALDLWNLSVPVHTASVGPLCSVTYGIDKTPDLAHKQAFLLNKVINGGGGETEFKFKDHVLANTTNQYNENMLNDPNYIIPTDLEGADANDGLCVDEIIVRDGFSSENTVTYKYTYADGQRFYRGGWFWYPTQMEHFLNSVREKAYIEHFTFPQQFFRGSNHGYSTATIKMFGFNGELLSHQEHTFSNLKDYWEPSRSNLWASTENLQYEFGGNTWLKKTFRFWNFRTYRMGLPIETKTFDPVGNLLSKSTKIYDAVSSTRFGKAYPVPQFFTYKDGSGFTAGGKILNALHTPFDAGKMRLAQEVTTRYVGGNAYAQTMTYGYDGHDNVQYVGWTDSRGKQYRKHYRYHYQLHSGGNPEARQHVSVESTFRIDGADSVLVDASAGTLQFNNPVFRTTNAISLKSDDVVSSANATDASTLYWAFNNPSSVTPAMAALAEADKQYQTYDLKGNITETYETQAKADVARIWDNRIGQKIAEAVNAKFVDIAYTSFEGSFAGPGIADDNKGNWDFNPVYVELTANFGGYNGGAMTGRYRYSLSGIPAKITSLNNLQANKKYLLTFWATGAPIAKVTNGTQQQSITFSQQREIGSWKLFTAVLNNTFAGKVEFTGNSGVQIDELRLHPLEATMTTTCYEPLYGPNTTCDGLNNISYQEYDVLGRASVTRDIKGNIRSFIRQGKATTDN